MITTEQWDRFFEALGVSGVVKTAARVSGMDRRTVYRHIDAAQAKDATPEALAWLERYKEAVREAIDTLEGECWRRAVEGVDEPVIGRVGKDQDGIITMVKKYDTTLMCLLMKARDPGRFRERVSTEVSGPGGGPVQTETKVIAVPAIEEGAAE